MGLCIFANCKNGLSMDGGYGMLAVIREQVAKDLDPALGKHYETLKDAPLFDREQFFADYNKKLNEILESLNFSDDDNDILDFLFANDCGGKINYKTCKKIYNIIKDDNEHFGLGYWRPLPNQKDVPFLKLECEQISSWDYFKQMLLQSYSHRCNLVWC